MTSHTNIFRYDPLEYLVEVPQRDIDYWCSLCQFPIGEGGNKCSEKWQIQLCWDLSQAIAGKWHRQHECPFIHKREICRCNDFKTIEEAFKAAGLEYRK